jgi:predicted SnoaL-like aldol condensation-catalyzing enzyme
MLSSDIEKVLTVFRGVAGRDAELATKYLNLTKYTEHSPHVADGVEGLKEYVRHGPSKGHDLEVVRAFQDGLYVFTQAKGDMLGKGVFFDIFRFEDGFIVEHWMVSTEAALPNQSGHTQTDGPTEAKHDQDTEENKSIVGDYYKTIHISGEHSKIPQYFHGDHCIRHEPGVRDGVAAFTCDLKKLIQNRSIDEIKFLFAQGDFVFIAAKGSVDGEPCVYVDLYRIEDNKIAERWGFSERIPPRQQWKNNNDML